MAEDKHNEFYSPLPRIMLTFLLVGIVGCIVFSVLYNESRWEWMFSCAITFGMIAYHMFIRYLSPVILVIVFHKKYDYKFWWFKQKKWESNLYRMIKVKQWKGKVIAYNPSEFSMKVHSLQEIVNNMCHAELVHEFIVLLSFTSLLFSIPFESFPAFLITACIAALFDIIFVVLQRYNRPRMIKLMERNSH